ncbi:uncharacterized protein DUF2695 [Pseudonocardia cypriaca]|uniref:Uncharacterized protein DUF2695 n=2 Tax=Pseudonocardia cypriaca TaxID=882449 RepID=A0A543GBC9_9PSEU|nr:uncharacterized protein DUF2695 [Pseudonocardia cypriaca]
MRPGTVGAMTNFFDDLPWHDYDDPDGDPEHDTPELSLSLEQQAALAAAVEQARRSCDGTLRAAQEWARRAGVDWPPLRRELEENGGYCDCEAVLNVFGGDFDRVFGLHDADPD